MAALKLAAEEAIASSSSAAEQAKNAAAVAEAEAAARKAAEDEEKIPSMPVMDPTKFYKIKSGGVFLDNWSGAGKTPLQGQEIKMCPYNNVPKNSGYMNQLWRFERYLIGDNSARVVYRIESCAFGAFIDN